MHAGETRIVPSLEKEGGTMAEFLCDGCGHTKAVEFRNYKPGDKLRGVVLCKGCGQQTFFEMKETILSFVPGKQLIIPPTPNVPQDSREKFMEAKLCYFSLAFRAAAVMLRASVESALAEKGYRRGRLELRIKRAKHYGVIDEQDYTLAHGSRLIGNRAIHTSSDIKPAQIQTLFGAVTEILDKLFP